MLSGLGISFQNLNLLHFDQIISFIDQSLLTGLIKFGSSVDEAQGPSLKKALCSEREQEREREKEREKKKAV